MLLGISSRLEHSTPQEWASKHKQLDLQCVNFPVDYLAGEETFMAYKKAADEAGLIIAEVGVWRNTLASSPSERRNCIDYAIGQLQMAELIGSRCCVNVVGTPYGPRWDGGYRDNYSRDLWHQAVLMIREIIDAVKPRNTKYCIESMPWMIPSTPDEYVRLINDVERDEFGVHLDIVNMITSPEKYFFNERFIAECFRKLGNNICSCHLKDIRLKEEYTFQLQECACGEGILDIQQYLRLADNERKDMPMIIEHLNTDEEYRNSVMYVQRIFSALQA